LPHPKKEVDRGDLLANLLKALVTDILMLPRNQDFERAVAESITSSAGFPRRVCASPDDERMHVPSSGAREVLEQLARDAGPPCSPRP
jgi:hypothetical protein